MMKSPLPEWHPVSTGVIGTICANDFKNESELEPEFELELERLTEYEAYLNGLTDYHSW